MKKNILIPVAVLLSCVLITAVLAAVLLAHLS